MTKIKTEDLIRWSIFSLKESRKQKPKPRIIVPFSVQCRWVERSHDILCKTKSQITTKWTTEEKIDTNNGILIEVSPHYNAEIIYIHWGYLNIRWFYILCIRPPLPPFLRLHFSVAPLFHSLGIDWLQKFFFATFVVVKYTNILLDSVMCTFTLCMQKAKNK